MPGISQKVLTARLRALELDGAIQRKVFESKRPHVEYSLTPWGERLRGLILNGHDLVRKTATGTNAGERRGDSRGEPTGGNRKN